MDFLHQPVELTLDQCIKCNICVTKCPVSPVTDLFPGPKYEGPQAGRFRQPDGFSPDKSVDYCSGCRVCNMACPTGVRIAEINARARARMVSQGKFPWRIRLRNNLLARSELLGKVGQPIAPLANLVLANKAIRWGMDVVLGIHRKAPLPAFSGRRFTRWFHRRERPEHRTRQVVYFHGCATEYYEPRIGRAAVQVLEANGFEVIIPSQNCCGLPLLSNGEFPAARRYHANNVRHMVEYARRGIPIVGTSTSCTLTIKEEAPELLDFYSEDARLVARGTFDMNEFLLELWEAGTLNMDFQALPLTLAYHAPCQYRAHRLGRPAVDILGLIPDLNILESKADCCGIAGTYGYKTEKYQIGMDVGIPLFDFARQASSPVVICDSETCRWQITHGTGIPSIHPIELLAMAYGVPPEGALAEVMKIS
ncbi:MAG TPA: anaerobic glycerol-3-phosphate dehydrogenase subunit C [Anaerolineales bacterium]